MATEELSAKRLHEITEFLQEEPKLPATDYPDLSDFSIRDQMILLSAAHGYTQTEIATEFHLTQGAVSKILKRADPFGVFFSGEEAKKKFVVSRAHGLVLEALDGITPEKLAECTVSQLSRISKMMMEISAIATRKDPHSINPKKINKVVVEFIDPTSGSIDDPFVYGSGA